MNTRIILHTSNPTLLPPQIPPYIYSVVKSLPYAFDIEASTTTVPVPDQPGYKTVVNYRYINAPGNPQQALDSLTPEYLVKHYPEALLYMIRYLPHKELLELASSLPEGQALILLKAGSESVSKVVFNLAGTDFVSSEMRKDLPDNMAVLGLQIIWDIAS